MDTQLITLDREEAARLHRKYQECMQWSAPIDHEIDRVYKAIAQNRMVIRALQSIVDAGLGDDGLPKLAIIRADAERCSLYLKSDGGARFSVNDWQRDAHHRCYIDLPAGSFPDSNRRHRHYHAQVPLVPLPLRPPRGLANFHILFEAEWRPVPPKDPMLLQRVGQSDLWIVRAAWDLTEIERAVLAGRL